MGVLSCPPFSHFRGRHAHNVDAKDAEEKLRSKEPHVLYEGETIELAFKSFFDTTDKSYLTSHRVLLQRRCGIDRKRKHYESIPYTSIQAFSVEANNDMILKIWSAAHNDVKIEFAKDEINPFTLKQFMNGKVLRNLLPHGTHHTAKSQPLSTEKASDYESLMEWFGKEAREHTAEEVQELFKSEYPILVSDETVELAFQCQRNFTVLTDKRIILVNFEGIVDTKLSISSISWKSVHAFSVHSDTALSQDSIVTFFTNIIGCQVIKQEFSKLLVDFWAIKTCITNKILGEDENAPAPPSAHDHRKGHVDMSQCFWEEERHTPLDAVEMNKVFHASPPILQSHEVVEIALKGRRDIIMFTSKRVLKVDPKDLSGETVEYISIPWSSIVGFAVKTAGKYESDTSDSQVLLWTELMYEVGDLDLEAHMALWELLFNKDQIDIMTVKKYLSTHCLKVNDALNIDSITMNPNESMKGSTKDLNLEHFDKKGETQTQQGFEDFLHKLSQDHQQGVDPNEISEVLREDLPILLSNEHVLIAFEAGRNMTLFTNARLLIIDIEGWSNAKAEYKSIPYSSIRAFAAHSAGRFERNSQVNIYTSNQWSLAKVSLEFMRGKANINTIHKVLSMIVMDSREGGESFFNTDPNQVMSERQMGNQNNAFDIGELGSWLKNDTVEEDPVNISRILHEDPSILLKGEDCEKVYRSGRDMYVYTNLRFILIDVQTLTGKTEVLSIPWPCIKSLGVYVSSGSSYHSNVEVHLFPNFFAKREIRQHISVRDGDAMEINGYLGGKLLEFAS